MADIMMALGDFRFSLDTAAYQRLDRVAQWRWEPQDRIGRPPAHQFLGPGAETVTLDGVIYPEFRGGFEQLDAMRRSADAGEPLDLVDGTGRVWGLWCLTEVKETASVFHADGRPKKQEFTLQLVKFGEDAAGGQGAS